MATPTFFTVEGDYKAVIGDSMADPDVDPDLGPVTARVVFRPAIQDGDVILAIDADPRPTGYIAAPIIARIDTDGRLKKRAYVDISEAAPEDILHFASFAAFPAIGDTTKIYEAEDTDIEYRWDGEKYLDYDPVRLLADTPLLELETPLLYIVEYTDVQFNGAPGIINGFVFQAPNVDEIVNLIRVGRVPGTTGVGITRGLPGDDGHSLDSLVRDGDEFVGYVLGVEVGRIDISDLIFNPETVDGGSL